MVPIFNKDGSVVAWIVHFDKDGNVVAWIVHDDAITDNLGNYQAVIDDGAVCDYVANFLGVLHAGYIWDRNGDAVAFIPGAGEGPVLPRMGAIPRPPPVGKEPVRPTPLPAIERVPVYSKRWSATGWDEFLGGRQEPVALQS